MEEEEALVTRNGCAEQVQKIVLHDNIFLVSDIATILMSDVESLGPYHHWKFKKDIAAPSARGLSLKISTAEEYKVQSAAKVWQKQRKDGKSFKSMEGMMRSDIERFYNWKLEDGKGSKNFTLMMAVDSSFLLCSFKSGHSHPQPAGDPSEDYMGNLNALQICIKCDILKLENQIPLSVLKHVFHHSNNEERGAVEEGLDEVQIQYSNALYLPRITVSADQEVLEAEQNQKRVSRIVSV